ncbi:MAG: TonB-dependent receptor [Opitutaceae bacterium]|nr:TonB-dependent receptor [Opitutaceae bacterium]
MKVPTLSCLCVLAAFSAPTLRAASAAAPTTQVLPAVDVVATPIVADTTVNPFGFQTTIIGREQIEALNAADVAAALRRTPGVTIARYNPVGSFGGGEGGAVFLRGLGSSRPGGEIKTTIDGVPIGNGVFNHPLLDLLPLDLASGVEVSRRAEPVLAGNMFASVNMLVPRAPESGQFIRGTTSAGSFGAFSEKLEAGGRWGPAEIYAGQSYRRADGHRPDADGRLANGLARIGWHVTPRLELSYLAHRTDNRATDPGPEPGAGIPPTRGDVYTTAAWLHLAGANWARAEGAGGLKAYVSDGEANWYRRGTSANADSLNDYRLTGVRWRESQHVWEGGEIVGGVDLDWTRGETVSVPPGVARPLSFGPESFRLASAYVGANHTWRAADGTQVTPSIGGREYWHEEFGRAWAPQAGLALRRGPLQLHAGFSRAVNFPGLEVAAFSTVAIPALGQTWRTLRPERLEQTEAGIRYDLGAATAIELTVFRNQGRDRFVFVPPPPPPFRFINVETFRTQGAELTFMTRPIKTLSLFAGASKLQATPADLPYAPRWSLVGGLTWRIMPSLTLNVDSSYVSAQRAGSQARAGGALNTERIPSFALLNARIGYAFQWDAAHRTEVFVAVENALDREYRYRPGYPMPGIGYTFGLSAGW